MKLTPVRIDEKPMMNADSNIGIIGELVNFEEYGV
jgi:hypothetical protein